ncbi:unnamed protein product [Rotaria sp. Silwood1]|nr:unnamed protein product [Rotaria sp. Silwood1]
MSSGEILYQMVFHYSQFYFVTIATILGTGVLGLPTTLSHSGFGPFLICIFISYFVQVLLIFFFTELLQKAYYRNIEKLKENEQEEVFINIDIQETPTYGSNYDLVAKRVIFFSCSSIIIFNQCLSIEIFVHFLLLLSTFDLLLIIIGEIAHFWDSTVNHKSTLYSKCCLIFGIAFNYFVSILLLSIHSIMNDENSLIIEICRRMTKKKFIFIKDFHDEKPFIPTMIVYVLFILIDLLTYSWIYMSYSDIYHLKQKTLATIFFSSLVFTNFKQSERSLMVNLSLKRIRTVYLFVISNMIATLPVLTMRLFNISIDIYQRIFLIYFTTLPWLDCITFLFYHETKLIKRNCFPKRSVSHENVNRQQRIGRRLNSYREMYDAETVKKCLPNLHSLGELFLPSFFSNLFTLIILSQTIALLISYALAGSQAFAVLLQVQYIKVIPGFCWILAFIILLFHSWIQLIISVLTFCKGTLFTIIIIITLVVGTKIQNPVKDDYSAMGDSILMCTIALAGFINIMPMMFTKLKQTREEVSCLFIYLLKLLLVWLKIIGFNISIFLGLTTCVILNIVWCWSVLEIVPQRSVCLSDNFNQSIPMAYNLFNESLVEGQCIYSPSLEKSAKNGEIATVSLSIILEDRDYSYKYISVLIQLFVLISVSVSFITIGSILYHTSIVDSYWDVTFTAETKYRGIFKYLTVQRVVRWTLWLIAFTIVFAVAFNNPKGFKIILEQVTNLLISIQMGVFVAIMIYKVSSPIFNSHTIPFQLPNWFFYFQYIIPVYFISILIYDIYVISQHYRLKNKGN